MPLSPTLERAIDALKQKGSKLTCDWLLSDASDARVTTAHARDGSLIFVVGSLSQDSRISPQDDWKKYILKRIPPGFTGNIYLFGLGSPTLPTLLLEKYKVIAFEPDPAVARQFLSEVEISPAISDGSLRLLSPWELRETEEKPLSPFLLTHLPSQRRHPAAYELFKNFLRPIPKLPQEPLRLLIIPPFSGGSLSMGQFLQNAAQTLKLNSHLLDWPQELLLASKELAEKPHILELSDSAKKAPALFASALEYTLEALEKFKPHLTLALAQAPLDLKALSRLKESNPENQLAFWFVEDYRRFTYINEIAQAYDLVFHIQGNLLEPQLRNWGMRRAYYLPLAADDGIFKPQKSPDRYLTRISFMGAAYPNRLKIFEELALNLPRTIIKNEDFRIFGSGWNQASPSLKKYLFDKGRRVTLEETAWIYAGTEINLNIHSGEGKGFCPLSQFVNPRTFEIASTGAFQIVDQRPLLSDLFSSKELAIAQEPENLLELVEYYLEKEELRRKIGQAARERVQKEHLYSHRLENIIKLAFTN